MNPIYAWNLKRAQPTEAEREAYAKAVRDALAEPNSFGTILGELDKVSIRELTTGRKSR